MHYYQEDNPKDRLYGILAACAAYILIAFLVVTLTFSFNSKERANELLAGGVMIDLGVDMSGYGMDSTPEKVITQRETESVDEEENNITDSQIAVNVKKEKPVEKKKEPKKEPEKKEPPKPKVNQAALFPGKGEDAGKGEVSGASSVTGSPDGTPGGSGSGGNSSGIGNASLDGRSLRGALPSPTYNVNSGGRVVVEVRVSQQGVVESAVFKAQGSTTTNNQLVRSAIDAAKKARFNVDENAPLTQIGTITYNFQLL